MGGRGRVDLRRALKWSAFAAAAVLVVLAEANQQIVARVGPHLYADVRDVPARQVAIVPGARVWPDGTPSGALADRLACAVGLYRAGRVERVLVSGDHGAVEYDEPNAMRAWLRSQGLPSRHIHMDHAGFRTLDTMVRARRVFDVRGAVVCTQAFHLARSVFLARQAGIDAVGLVADRYVDPNAVGNALREFLARARAFADVVVGTEPSALGPPLPIDGAAEQTHDRWTARFERP